MVGATRFELVTFCTPSKRATSLRYAPTNDANRKILSARRIGVKNRSVKNPAS